MTLLERLENFIRHDMTLNDFVELHYRYCQAIDDIDSIVYDMSQFNLVMSSDDPETIAQRVAYGNFKPSDGWFWFSGYGNLISGTTFADLEDIQIFPSDIARYIVGSGDSLGSPDIQSILDEDQDDDDGTLSYGNEAD